jgi:hypothetical protein
MSSQTCMSRNTNEVIEGRWLKHAHFPSPSPSFMLLSSNTSPATHSAVETPLSNLPISFATAWPREILTLYPLFQDSCPSNLLVVLNLSYSNLAILHREANRYFVNRICPSCRRCGSSNVRPCVAALSNSNSNYIT